jgi:glutamate synthase domain-containing protein 2
VKSWGAKLSLRLVAANVAGGKAGVVGRGHKGGNGGSDEESRRSVGCGADLGTPRAPSLL